MRILLLALSLMISSTSFSSDFLAIVNPLKIKAGIIHSENILGIDVYEVAIFIPSSNESLQNLKLYNNAGSVSEESAEKLLSKFNALMKDAYNQASFVALTVQNKKRIGLTANFTKYVNLEKILVIK